jgi:hypothetical protein
MLRGQADHQNRRRWLSLDLLCGYVTREHPWFDDFRTTGVPETALHDLAAQPCAPDIVGINSGARLPALPVCGSSRQRARHVRAPESRAGCSPQ